jgi:hypothetical protein
MFTSNTSIVVDSNVCLVREHVQLLIDHQNGTAFSFRDRGNSWELRAYMARPTTLRPTTGEILSRNIRSSNLALILHSNQQFKSVESCGAS